MVQMKRFLIQPGFEMVPMLQNARSCLTSTHGTNGGVSARDKAEANALKRRTLALDHIEPVQDMIFALCTIQTCATIE